MKVAGHTLPFLRCVVCGGGFSGLQFVPPVKWVAACFRWRVGVGGGGAVGRGSFSAKCLEEKAGTPNPQPPIRLASLLSSAPHTPRQTAWVRWGLRAEAGRRGYHRIPRGSWETMAKEGAGQPPRGRTPADEPSHPATLAPGGRPGYCEYRQLSPSQEAPGRERGKRVGREAAGQACLSPASTRQAGHLRLGAVPSHLAWGSLAGASAHGRRPHPSSPAPYRVPARPLE